MNGDDAFFDASDENLGGSVTAGAASNNGPNARASFTKKERLNRLRERMNLHFDDSEFQPASLNAINIADTLSLDDQSISSWGKKFLSMPLAANAADGGGAKVVVPASADTISTKGGGISSRFTFTEEFQPQEKPSTCCADQSSPQNAERTTSCESAADDGSSYQPAMARSISETSVSNIGSVRPSSFQSASRLLTTPSPFNAGKCTEQAEGRSSSGSSRSNTLEHNSTLSSGGTTLHSLSNSNSKSGSLERSSGLLSSRTTLPGSCSLHSQFSLNGKTSRSSSFNRDGAAFNCDQLLMSKDEFAEAKRKNSAATELIESLTNLVVNNRRESSSSSKALESTTPSRATPLFHDEQPVFACSSDAVPVAPPRRSRKKKAESPEEAQKRLPVAAVNDNGKRAEATDEICFKKPDEGTILSSVIVKNLDTGERIPLNQADDKIPRCSVTLQHPLSLQMLERTGSINEQKEHLSDASGSVDSDDTESMASFDVGERKHDNGLKLKDHYIAQVRDKSLRAKRLFGKTVEKTISKLKQAKEGAAVTFRNNEESSTEEESEELDNKAAMRVRASHSNKGPYEFDQVKLVQELPSTSGAIWCLKFSPCGRLLSAAGQDKCIRVWVLTSSFSYFSEMKHKYCNSEAFSDSMPSPGLRRPSTDEASTASSSQSDLQSEKADAPQSDEDWSFVFMPKPFCSYRGHAADVLDLSWSKNFFLLSSSMDRTVRLWHLSRNECLCSFQHCDFVTAIAFLPKDDRYFLSGSLDGKLRLWNIPEKRVILWNEVENSKMITALTFVTNGKYVVAGTFDGRCVFYTSDQLKYYTQIEVKSSRGKNAKAHKITGLEASPDKLLVTSNDSRIRLYDLRDLSLTCKYKGYTNGESQIKARFSSNFKYIISGSEDRCIYIWRTAIESLTMRKDRNNFWESIRAHTAMVTAAIFAPKPALIFNQLDAVRTPTNAKQAAAMYAVDHNKNDRKQSSVNSNSVVSTTGEVIVSADFNGSINIFANKAKAKAATNTFFRGF